MQVGETEWEIFAHNLQLVSRTAVTAPNTHPEAEIGLELWTFKF